MFFSIDLPDLCHEKIRPPLPKRKSSEMSKSDVNKKVNFDKFTEKFNFTDDDAMNID